jgi:hypothetical protein
MKSESQEELKGITFPFHSRLGMEFESQVDLNRYIGVRAPELYQQLGKCSRYPIPGKRESLMIPGDDWDIHLKDGVVAIYKKNKHIPASVALNKIFNTNGNILDCVTASHIVLAKCISEILGDSFDETYEILAKKLGDDILYLPRVVAHFSTNPDNLTTKNVSQPGGLVLVRNFPNYKIVQPDGAYSNDNLITVEDKEGSIKYTGFGEEYKDGPLSYGAVRNYMESSYYADIQDSGIADTMFDINVIIENIMGFKKTAHDKTSPYEYPSAYEIRKSILEKDNKIKKCSIQDMVFKETVFDFMQTYPVYFLSFEILKRAKEANYNSGSQ